MRKICVARFAVRRLSVSQNKERLNMAQEQFRPADTGAMAQSKVLDSSRTYTRTDVIRATWQGLVVGAVLATIFNHLF